MIILGDCPNCPAVGNHPKIIINYGAYNLNQSYAMKIGINSHLWYNNTKSQSEGIKMSFDFKKLTSRPSMPTKLMLTIRLVIGVYLFYLVYDIRDSIFSSEGNLFFIIIAILFIVCGGIIVVFSAKDLLSGRYLGGPLDPDRDASDTESGADTVEDAIDESAVSEIEVDASPAETYAAADEADTTESGVSSDDADSPEN